MRFKALFLLATLLTAGLVSTNGARADIGYQDLDHGTVWLLYKDGNAIVVQRCEDEREMTSRETCVAKPGFPAERLPVQEFKNLLMIALKLPLGRYPEFIEKDRRIWRAEVGAVALPALLEQQAALETKLSELKKFYGDPPKNQQGLLKITKTEKALTAVTDQLATPANYVAAMEQLQGRIDALVESYIGNATDPLFDYAYFADDIDAEFVVNLLHVYFASSLADWVFVQVSEINNDLTAHLVNAVSYNSPAVSDRAFSIGSREVTQLQYAWVTGENPSHFQDEKYCPGEYLTLNREGKSVPVCMRLPVENVTWKEIDEKFLPRLNAISTTYHYQLPTKEQWERAARGGTRTAYFFGNDADKLKYYGWSKDNSRGLSGDPQPHSVATAERGANAYGIYDGHGNVWEWTTSLDILGVTHAIRGGSWANIADDCDSGYSIDDVPKPSNEYVGFRLIRSEKK